MSKPPDPGRREAELDFEDFLDLRVTGSKNEPKRRRTRSSEKTNLRDALDDPDALDQLMDELD